MAIFVVSVVVVYKVDKTVPTLFTIPNLEAVEELFLITNELVESAVESPIPIAFATPSLVKLKLPLNSTNQVPPDDVIKPLVYMLSRLNESATLVADAVVVLIQVVANAPNSICGDAILRVKSYELPMFIVALNATLILAVDAFVFVRVNELRVSVDEIVIVCEVVAKLVPILSRSTIVFRYISGGADAEISFIQNELVHVCPFDATIWVLLSNEIVVTVLIAVPFNLTSI